MTSIHPFAGQDLAGLLHAQAVRHAERPFLIWAPFEGQPRTWTYAEFATAVRSLAGGLAARGVKPGDRVLLHSENSPEFLLTYFACAWIGAVCVVTHPRAAGPELTYVAEHTGAVGAIVQPASESLFAEHCAALAWLAVTGPGDALWRATECERSRPDASRSLSMLFTSGTTSRPKAVVWTHANALWAARSGAAQLALREDDVFQVCLPLYHVVGLAWSVFPALWAGAAVLLQPRFSASRFWDVAIANRATVASHVQFSSGVLARQPTPPGHAFRLWGNSTWLPEHEAHFGVPVVGWWGMTELVAPGMIGDRTLPQTPGSMGRPALGYTVRILDGEGRPVGPGETGELFVRGTRGLTLFAEYFGDAAATAAAFTEQGDFRTGDRVRLHEDGSISFVERVKDVIKVGGEGVSAAEVERVLKQVDGVADAAVVGRPDPVYGEVCVAFIVPSPPAEKASLATRALERCRTELAPFKVPREIRELTELPRASLNKVAKGELRRLAATPADADPSFRT